MPSLQTRSQDGLQRISIPWTSRGRPWGDVVCGLPCAPLSLSHLCFGFCKLSLFWPWGSEEQGAKFPKSISRSAFMLDLVISPKAVCSAQTPSTNIELHILAPTQLGHERAKWLSPNTQKFAPF